MRPARSRIEGSDAMLLPPSAVGVRERAKRDSEVARGFGHAQVHGRDRQ